MAIGLLNILAFALLIGSRVTNGVGNIGCLVSPELQLCEDNEICTNDDLFGTCVSLTVAAGGEGVSYRALGQDQLAVVRTALEGLRTAGYGWMDPATQCVVTGLLESFRLGVSLDVSECPKNPPLSMMIDEMARAVVDMEEKVLGGTVEEQLGGVPDTALDTALDTPDYYEVPEYTDSAAYDLGDVQPLMDKPDKKWSESADYPDLADYMADLEQSDYSQDYYDLLADNTGLLPALLGQRQPSLGQVKGEEDLEDDFDRAFADYLAMTRPQGDTGSEGQAAGSDLLDYVMNGSQEGGLLDDELAEYLAMARETPGDTPGDAPVEYGDYGTPGALGTDYTAGLGDYGDYGNYVQSLLNDYYDTQSKTAGVDYDESKDYQTPDYGYTANQPVSLDGDERTKMEDMVTRIVLGEDVDITSLSLDELDKLSAILRQMITIMHQTPESDEGDEGDEGDSAPEQLTALTDGGDAMISKKSDEVAPEVLGNGKQGMTRPQANTGGRQCIRQSVGRVPPNGFTGLYSHRIRALSDPDHPVPPDGDGEVEVGVVVPSVRGGRRPAGRL